MINSESGKKIYFSDVFGVEHSLVEEYGALDISLIADNPAFIDPFLIFSNEEYSHLHDFIIEYLKFLRDKARQEEGLNQGTFEHYYKFPEVKEIWLGYSISGNRGSGLGKDFASSLFNNLNFIFKDFGEERITESSHLEKLCLVEEGIGVDKISDFTANLIKKFLLEYTQTFAINNIDQKYIGEFPIRKVYFDFEEKMWKDGIFKLPKIKRERREEFVLLTPIKILTKETTWISKNDFLNQNTAVFEKVSNSETREKLNNYFVSQLAEKRNENGEYEKDYSKNSRSVAWRKTFIEFPEIFDYYIKEREDNREIAKEHHAIKPEQVTFFSGVSLIQRELNSIMPIYRRVSSLEECIEKIEIFKRILESNSNELYMNGIPLKEKNLQLMFKLHTSGSLFDYNSEVNNGRGSIDFIVSYGSGDKVGIELKLASNSKLKNNLLKQTEVYKKDGNLQCVIKIIFCFSEKDFTKVNGILSEMGERSKKEIFLIDCRKKDSASNVK